MTNDEYPALLPADGIARLRDALLGADFTSDGIAAYLGPDVTAAVGRNDFRSALAVTAAPAADRKAIATLIRLYICGQTEPEAAVARAFGSLPLEAAVRAGLVEAHEGGLRAAIDLEPYLDGSWLLSDLPAGTRPGPVRKDHVLGVGGASSTLANAVIREPVGSALDLGTGCGVQAMHLSRHADRVVATDLSRRALSFAATAAALAGLDWDLRSGDMIEPVRGERFDLVVSNPPFVVGPGTTTHTYRDSGRAGDAISAELAAAAPDLLNLGGTLQFLANWVQVSGEDWADRVASWFAGTGMDVWVIQREVSDPMSYVDLWLSDAGESGDPRRAAAWLDWFDANRVEAVGFGIVTARNTGAAEPVVRVETLRQPLAHPFGPEISKWFGRQDWLRTHGTLDELLDTSFRAATGLKLHQEADQGPDGWDVTTQNLAQTSGLGWTEEVDPVTLALVGGANGDVTLREQVGLLAAAYDVPEYQISGAAGLIVSHLVERGFLEAADA